MKNLSQTECRNFTRFELEQVARHAAVSVSEETLRGLMLTEDRDSIHKAMIYTLSSKVWGERLHDPVEHIVTFEEEHLIPLPATWWELFKQTYADRWWLRWIVKRYPVRTVEMRIRFSGKRRVIPRIVAAYPELNRLFPQEYGRAVVDVFGYDDPPVTRGTVKIEFIPEDGRTI